MIRRLVTGAAFVAFAGSAMAVPVLGTQQFQTETLALAEDAIDLQNGGGPASSGPFLTSASAFGVGSFAAGGAVAAPGLMSTSAEADSVSGFANAVGSAKYVANYTGVGGLFLHLAYDPSSSMTGSGFSEGSVLLTVTSGGLTILQELLTATTTFDRQVSVLGNPNQTVELLLWSQANTLTGGAASNSGLLSFGITAVPEPATWVLAAGALLLMLGRRRMPSPRA
jgi:hypothetical protein